MGCSKMKDTYILDHIKELCAKEHWTNYELAKNSGLPQSTIVNLFLRSNQPTFPTLLKICDAFGITLAQFFSDPDIYPDLTDEQKELLAIWDSLPCKHKEHAKGYLIYLSNL